MNTINNQEEEKKELNCCENLITKVNILIEKAKRNYSKILRTLLLTSAFLCVGLQANIIGPSVPTFMEEVNANFERMSQVISAKSGGYLLGALIGGFIGNYFDKHRYVLLFIILINTSSIFLTLAFQIILSYMVFLMISLGFLHANLKMNCNILLGTMWDGHSGPAYNFMHTGDGIGGILATIIVVPFLANPKNSKEEPILYTVPPFSILAGVAICSGICFIIVWLVDRRKQKEINKNPKLINKETNNGSSSKPTIYTEILDIHNNFDWYEKSVVIIWPLASFFIVAIERITANFMVIYMRNSAAQMSAKDMLSINLEFWIMFTFGRIIFSVITTKISVKWILLLCAQMTFLTFVVKLLVVDDKLNNFCVIAVFGFFLGGLMPCLIGSVNKILHINGLIAMVLELGSALGGLILTIVTGILVTQVGYQAYTYIITSLCGITCILLIAIVILIEIIIRNRKKEDKMFLVPENNGKLSYESITPPASEYEEKS